MTTCTTCSFYRRRGEFTGRSIPKRGDSTMICTNSWFDVGSNVDDGVHRLHEDGRTARFIPPPGFGCILHTPVP